MREQVQIILDKTSADSSTDWTYLIGVLILAVIGPIVVYWVTGRNK